MNALLRQLLLPKLHARMFWLPIVGGVASFCSFDVVHPYFDAINQMIISQEWDSGTVEFVSGGSAIFHWDSYREDWARHALLR